MKFFLVSALLIITSIAIAQQPLIHAHNDYSQPEPFTNALHNKAYSIEADVYAVGDSLYVTHDKKDIIPGRTLNTMYLLKIIDSFAKYNGHINADTAYAPNLVIDIKENSAAVIRLLLQLLALHQNIFDRKLNPHAVQIVLSGERGPADKWDQWPACILFDGRPYENYDSTAWRRIAFISDSYSNYSYPEDSIIDKLKLLAAKVHASGKLLRLWAIPDNKESWKKLLHLGMDIINTDKVSECRNYFQEK